MTDIAKAVLSGAWELIVGWVLPTAVVLAVFGVVVLPELPAPPLLGAVAGASPADQMLVLLVAAVLLGIVLSAVRSPLYRMLEGYYLWPARLRERRRQAHVARRDRLEQQLRRAGGETESLDPIEARLVEQYRRYPASGRQVLPTMLGNAMRRLEYYAYDRYRLDSQLLWHHLRSVVPEPLNRAADRARTGVDFFVCLCYLSGLLAVASFAAALSDTSGWLPLLLTGCLALAATVGSYWGAVLAVDSWAAAVRAMVDLGRVPLARSYGLVLPGSLTEERRMWEALGWLVGFPYHEEAAQIIAGWRAAPSPAGGPGATADLPSG